jgi:hypothetical protein
VSRADEDPELPYILEEGADFWDLLLAHERDRLTSRQLPLAPEELDEGHPRQEEP